jgi:hypothetical protein
MKVCIAREIIRKGIKWKVVTERAAALAMNEGMATIVDTVIARGVMGADAGMVMSVDIPVKEGMEMNVAITKILVMEMEEVTANSVMVAKIMKEELDGAAIITRVIPDANKAKVIAAMKTATTENREIAAA